MESQEKQRQKKSIELFANNSNGALDMKKSLEEKGYQVNHIYTGSTKPMVIYLGNLSVGAKNIRLNYGLF